MALSITIAIPALNEELGIQKTLLALDAEISGYPGPKQIAILANNCRDETADVCRKLAPYLMTAVFVETVELPPQLAHAGGARAASIEFGLGLSNPNLDAVIVTTDADSRPQQDWLQHIAKEFHLGADVVAGSIDFDPDEVKIELPVVRRLEAEYATLQAELSALADPLPHDPYPNHIWAWGANIAFTRKAYQRTKGIPIVPLAEDRALIAEFERVDCRVRHSLSSRVFTSSRTTGRSPGGLADLIATYHADDTYPCDAALEPALTVHRRADIKRRLRGQYPRPNAQVAALAQHLQLAELTLFRALDTEFFGNAWACVEAQSPMLRRERLYPHDLSANLNLARHLIETLKRKNATGRPINL
jgi:hypothetical protein